MQAIYQRKGGRLGQRRIDDILVTNYREQRAHTQPKPRVDTIGMDVKAHVRYQKGHIHAQEHLPEQAHRVAGNF